MADSQSGFRRRLPANMRAAFVGIPRNLEPNLGPLQVAVAFICHASALRPHGAEVDLESEGGELWPAECFGVSSGTG